MDTVRTIWKEEGFLGFFKGMKMRILIQSVSSGVGWGTYHLVKNFMAEDTKYWYMIYISISLKLFKTLSDLRVISLIYALICLIN